MEGLIKIRVEGDERQPIATCDLDETIESKGADLSETVIGWITQYATKNNLSHRYYDITRKGKDFHFKIN